MITRSNLIGCSKTTSMQTKTIYVSKSGADTMGIGTIASPFLTVARAIREAEKLPINFWGITISVGAGTYNEDVSLQMGVPSITLVGSNSDPSLVTINTSSPAFSGPGYINLRWLTFTGRIIVSGNTSADIHDCNFTGTNYNGAALSIDSFASIYNCKIDNYGIAINVGERAIVRARNNTGTGNSKAHQVYGILLRNGTYPSATTVDQKVDGGQIFQ